MVVKYDNCKLLKETKNYFDFEGNNENGAEKFRIYKIYFDNEKLKVNDNG